MDLHCREPKPRYLPRVSNAVERFLDAPYGAQLIIRSFAALLNQRETEEWRFEYTSISERYEALCAAVPELFGTEAPQPQTRQLVIRLLPHIFDMRDADEYTGQAALQSGEVLWDKGKGYTTVTQGIKWLVECALRRLPDGVPLYAETRKSLQRLLTPQPKYDSSKDYEEVELTDDCGVFTVVQPAFRLFTIWPRCDEASIKCLIDIVMSIALDVAGNLGPTATTLLKFPAIH